MVKKLTEEELIHHVSFHIEQSMNFYGNRFANFRDKARKYYEGEPYGNELEGRSKVVSRDVLEAVDGALSNILEPYVSGEQTVKFIPQGPEDVKDAEVASEYVNWIWNQQNEGYLNFYEWFKAALLFRYGVLKIWWDVEDTHRESYYEGLTDEELDVYQNDPNIEILDVESYKDPNLVEVFMDQADDRDLSLDEDGMPMIDEASFDAIPNAHNVRIRETNEEGKVKIQVVPSEEFLYDHEAHNIDDSRFLCHRMLKTRSDLLEMGVDKKIIDQINFTKDSYHGYFGDFEKIGRFDKEADYYPRDEGANDESRHTAWVYECYIHVDTDGDGISEFRKIVLAGEQEYVVVENEAIDDHPFSLLTPIPLPFKMVGLGLTDITMDIQEIKSTLWRQGLDNMYFTTHSRPIVNPENVHMDDLLNPRPGAPIIAKNPTQDIMPYPVTPQGQSILQFIEYADAVKENRTGVTRYNQGLDADSLNKTATGIKEIMNAGQQRVKTIARTFAETGVKHAFKKILRLVQKHDKEREILRVTGEPLKLDPRNWKTNYDVSVSVGLGSANKEQSLMMLNSMLQLDEKLIALQGGPQGPILNLKNIHNKITKMLELAGFKDVDSYYSDPDKYQPPQPPVGPNQQEGALDPNTQAIVQAEMAKIKQQAAADEQKMQMEMAKSMQEQHMKQQQLDSEIALKREQMERDFNLKAEELRLKYSQNSLEVGGNDVSYTP